MELASTSTYRVEVTQGISTTSRRSSMRIRAKILLGQRWIEGHANRRHVFKASEGELPPTSCESVSYRGKSDPRSPGLDVVNSHVSLFFKHFRQLSEPCRCNVIVWLQK